METEVAANFYNAKEALPFWVTLTKMGHPQPPTPMEVDNETSFEFLKSTMKKKCSKAIDMIFYCVRDRFNQNQFMIYWRSGSNNVGGYVFKHHSPAHHQSMRPKKFVCLIRQNPPHTYTENVYREYPHVYSEGVIIPLVIPLLTRNSTASEI